MAEIAPMATWKPFSGKSSTILKRDIVCVHTMVGTLSGSWNYANQPGNPYWHFGLGGGGTLWQCQDLRYRSASNLYGNPYVIPIETEDIGPYFPSWPRTCGTVPAWTTAQINKLVELIAWLCKRYNIPPVLIPDTQAGRRGLAYHRQGVPNSPEWRTGNLAWTKYPGKCCPDNIRIGQFKTIVIKRVQQLLGPAPTPTPPPEGFLMALTDAQQKEVYDAIKELNNSRKALLAQGKKSDGTILPEVWIVDAAFAAKYHIMGWQNVNVMHYLGAISADGTVDGHPKPFILPQGVLDQVPTKANTNKPNPYPH